MWMQTNKLIYLYDGSLGIILCCSLLQKCLVEQCVTMDLKTSHKGRFLEIEIYTTSKAE